jgi:two-component system cell cycle response regulator DivK
MKKILIVEDVAYNMELLVQLLEEDYELVTARDGESGVAMIEQERPDLVLLDMSLPKIDGWEVVRRVKATDTLKHIPVIGLSAHAMRGDREKALEAGCDDYLTKPLDDTLLYKKLDHYLGNEN